MKKQLDNGFISYDLVGQGIPILLIHGYPLSREIWQPQVNGLSDHATIITPDLRGHGESYTFDPPYTMDKLAHDCKLLLDDLSINTPVIVNGLSMGGYIAFALYRKFPELFKGMILTSTRAGEDSSEGKANRDASIKNAQENGVDSVVEGMLPKMFSTKTFENNPGLVESIHRVMSTTSLQGVVGALEGMRDRPDSTPLLPSIQQPVLIIHGEDDQLIPIKEAELMQNMIPNASLVRVADAGHLPNLEQTEIYNQAVLDFLKSIS